MCLIPPVVGLPKNVKILSENPGFDKINYQEGDTKRSMDSPIPRRRGGGETL